MADPESVRIRSYLRARQTASQQPATLAEQRTGYELLVENYIGHAVSLPEKIAIESVSVNGIPAEWIYPAGADTERVIVYFHGGAYLLGSLKTHRDLAARLSVAAGVRGLLIDYRLAPEHIFPAALDDALTTYRWLLNNGTLPENIILAGDSAGGNLSLALLQILREQHIPMPACTVLFSPWTDLIGNVQSRTTRNGIDPIFSGNQTQSLAKFYAGSENLENPLLSSINADLHGFPPLYIDVGNDEMLLDDSLVVAEHARDAAIPIELTVWDDMWHVFQQFASVLPEAQQSLERAGTFIRRQTRLSH